MKELEVSENLEWPSICHIQGGIYSKRIIGG